MKTTTIATLALAATFAAALPAAGSQATPGQAATNQAATDQAADADAAARAAIDATLQAMAVAKLAISEQYAKTHAWAHDAAAAGFDAPAGIPARIAVADGSITATFDAPASLAGKTLRLAPADTGDGMVHWRCEAAGLPDALMPKGCA
jgi:hypothetical protein